jgi:hypothetical protein
MDRNSKLFKVSIGLLVANLLMIFVIAFGFIFNLQTQQAVNQEEQVLGANNVPVFSPNYVMSDATFESTRAFPTEASVQAYLERVNSPLKNYSDQGQRASYWIFNAARGVTSSKWNVTPRINPGVILAFLEKEQSLLSLTNYNTQTDPERRIKTAMGYGCPDFSKCNPTYEGFANQVNWGAYQLQYNVNLATGSSNEPYRVNRTITTLDGYDVFLSNAATASAYRYTPHVYWGNYNLWKILTANGWGVSSQTYTYAQLDAVNLPNRSSFKNQSSSDQVSLDSVSGLLYSEVAIGTTGENIKDLQRFLRQEGFFTYPYITGYYGNITKTAQDNYLAARGENRNSSSGNRTDECSQLYARSWSIGQTGEDVKQLQQCLRNDNLFAWPVITGYFGNVTNQGLTTARSQQNISGGQTNSAQKPVYSNNRGVSASGLNVRSAPCGNRVSVAPWNTSGTQVEGPRTATCFGRSWNWYKVNFSSGQSGWVVDFYLSDSQASSNNSSTSGSVTTVRKGARTSGLNIRSGACGNKTGVVPWGVSGNVVSGPVAQTCLGGSIQWYQVNFSNGQSGWVSGFYLQ